MADVPGQNRSVTPIPRPAGNRFRGKGDEGAQAQPRRRPAGAAPNSAPSSSYRPSSYGRQGSAQTASRPVRLAGGRASGGRSASTSGASPVRRPASARSRSARTTRRSIHPAAVIVPIAGVVIAVVAALFLIAPHVPGLSGIFAAEESVPAGQSVTVTIPEGSGGDAIASILVQAHVIEDAKSYYAAVTKMGADQSLKPGDYTFKTGMDPEDVVAQLVKGPNAAGATLTIQEGLTVQQIAANVESTYGIKADAFLAQAKASNYAADYPFLQGSYNDSLEGYLYPKTYTFSGRPTADQIIRKLLDQFVLETKGLNLEAGANGLTEEQIVTMASLIERETAVEAERPTIASVIYNRLHADMALQIDAAIVYARGGGSQAVTYKDLEIDSPYNVYKNKGLTPGPICSPSISSIKAALQPAQTNYLYYVASAAGDGTHNFSDNYDQFMKDRAEYSSGSAS